MIIERADADDLGVILALRTEASDWLAQRGINQWAVAWPTPEEQNRRILTSIEAGETWMIRDENEATMGTVALDTFSDPKLWTPEEQADPAMYMHRLIIRRKHAGLGTEVIGLGMPPSPPPRPALAAHRRMDRQHRPAQLLPEQRLQARPHP